MLWGCFLKVINFLKMLLEKKTALHDTENNVTRAVTGQQNSEEEII